MAVSLSDTLATECLGKSIRFNMKSEINLNNLRIATPCPMDWDSMTGGERVRFCDSCSMNVYNLSAMTSAEITDLIEKTEARICGKLYKRADGTIITRDCPTGLRAVRKRAAGFASAVFAAVLSICSVAYSQEKAKSKKNAK